VFKGYDNHEPMPLMAQRKAQRGDRIADRKELIYDLAQIGIYPAAGFLALGLLTGKPQERFGDKHTLPGARMPI
jgi:hypothetical protein